MKKNETQFTFAERDSGVPNDIPLPVRTLSSKAPIDAPTAWIQSPAVWPANTIHLTDASTTDDGLCFIQPVLKQGAVLGHASSTEIGEAGMTLLQTCVVQRGTGGMASDIGEQSSRNHGLATQSL